MAWSAELRKRTAFFCCVQSARNQKSPEKRASATAIAKGLNGRERTVYDVPIMGD
jgi:hypothetical protein